MNTPNDYPMAPNIMYKLDDGGNIVTIELTPFKVDYLEPLGMMARFLALAALLSFGLGFGAIYYEHNTTHYEELPK